jgi:NDP-sugar pyrophosphorylase family protein
VGDGSRYGLRVRFVRDGPVLRGTGGAVVAALPLVGDSFWVTYGDTFLQLDVGAAELRFTDSGLLGLMTVLHNQDRLEPSNVHVQHDLVASYAKGASPGTHEHLDYGMVALRCEAFEPFTAEEPFDLGEVFTALASRRQLGAFEVGERFYDVGTVEALRTSEAYFAADRTWERLQPGG